MAEPSHRLIPKSLQRLFLTLLRPLINALARWGIHPNGLTLTGFVITCIAAAELIRGNLRTGGVLILLGGLFDSIDGNLARSTGKANRFGALFDSSMDRYGEFVMFLAIAAYFIPIKDFFSLAATFMALCGSIMVSYTRARAESLGFESKAGIMQRPERILCLGIGALIHPAAFKVSLWLVAILANLTALQRLRNASRQHGAEKQ